MIIPAVPPAHRSMLPAGRLQGPTPWVLALLMFLTLLAAAAAAVLAQSAAAISSNIAGRVTVQIVAADPVMRAEQAGNLRRAAAAAPFVTAARTVERDEMLAIMGRWFGGTSDGAADPVIGALPLPALVDIDLIGDTARQLPRLRALIDRYAPGARLIPHAEWLEPVARLIRILAVLAGLLILLMALASAAVVMMTARAALMSHQGSVEILHLIGATDRQISRLVQRRIVIDSAYGIGLGAVLAALVMAVLAWVLGDVTSGLLASDGGPWWVWSGLTLLPAAAIVLAGVTARVTLGRALRKML